MLQINDLLFLLRLFWEGMSVVNILKGKLKVYCVNIHTSCSVGPAGFSRKTNPREMEYRVSRYPTNYSLVL
jgi:hypothetical protein